MLTIVPARDNAAMALQSISIIHTSNMLSFIPVPPSNPNFPELQINKPFVHSHSIPDISSNSYISGKNIFLR